MNDGKAFLGFGALRKDVSLFGPVFDSALVVEEAPEAETARTVVREVEGPATGAALANTVPEPEPDDAGLLDEAAFDAVAAFFAGGPFAGVVAGGVLRFLPIVRGATEPSRRRG